MKKSEAKKLQIDVKKNITNTYLEKYQLIFDIISDDVGVESERNGRTWLLVQSNIRKEELVNYIHLDSHITIIWRNGDILKIDGYIENIKQKKDDILLLILNCLYAPETLEFITAK